MVKKGWLDVKGDKREMLMKYFVHSALLQTIDPVRSLRKIIHEIGIIFLLVVDSALLTGLTNEAPQYIIISEKDKNVYFIETIINQRRAFKQGYSYLYPP